MNIEFDAEIKNGKITIPKEYLKQLGRRRWVHVTLEFKQPRRRRGKSDYIDYLIKHPVKFSGLPLKRAQIYGS